jgi:flagellar hook assembly protein FlgD
MISHLMVAIFKNQELYEPGDDTQYVTQLAQFASMQQMQEWPRI